MYIYIYISKNVYIVNGYRVYILKKHSFQWKIILKKELKKGIPKEKAFRCNGHLEMIIFAENF